MRGRGDPADGRLRRGHGARSTAGPASCTRRSCPTRRAPSARSRPRPTSSSWSCRASETHNQKNVRRSVAESLVGARELVELAHGADVPVEAIVSTAFGCPYEGDVAPERVAQLAGHLLDAGADRLSFGDTTGHGDAAARRTTCSTRSSTPGIERRSRRPALPQHARHRARERARRRSSAASRASTRRSAVSAAVPYAPGASGNAVTEDLVHMLDDMGIETGIDLDALLDCARLAQDIVGRELPSALLHAGPAPATVRRRDRMTARRSDRVARAHRTGARRATSPRKARSSRGRTSCSSATGSRGCSTKARSSRTGCSPTRSPATCPPTAWSPASAASTAGRCA